MKNKQAKEKFTEEVIRELIEDYKNKLPLKDIKKKYSTSSDTIYKILDLNNIPRSNSKDLSKFYDLNNKELQYWIGYICADGNIEYNLEKRVYKVSLFSIDKEVMEKFQNFFGKTNVKRYNRKNSRLWKYLFNN